MSEIGSIGKSITVDSGPASSHNTIDRNSETPTIVRNRLANWLRARRNSSASTSGTLSATSRKRSASSRASMVRVWTRLANRHISEFSRLRTQAAR